MSLLQNDSEVVDKGRENGLADAKVSLRDQVVGRLYDQLLEADIGPKLSQSWELSTANIATALEKQRRYLDDLDNFDLGETEGKFGGVSNIHLPTSFIVCKTYHARFLEAILGVDPPFSMRARREDGTSRLPVGEDLMRYTLLHWCNNYRGVDEPLDSWIWNWCTTGTGVLKIRWKTDWERYLDVKNVTVPAAPLFSVDEKGNESEIPQFAVEEREETVTIKTFDGPQYDLVQMEDFRMVGGNGDPDLADKVMHRTYMTASDLWTKVDQGIFRQEAVEAAIKGGPDNEETGSGSAIKNDRKSDAGVNSSGTDTDLDRYEVIEACFKYDTTGNGIVSDIVVWFDKGSSEILGCTYLRRIMPTGERPYSVIHFHKRPGEELGLGLLEILHPLSVELDAMHNIRIDNAVFQSIPFFFYRASSSLDPDTIQIEPGVGIPMDDPQRDVVFPNVGNRTSFTAQEEAGVQSYIEKLTGISDLSLGVMSGTQGATRTASGVRALMGENNNNLSVHLRRLNKGWTKILRTTWHLLQNRLEPGFAFRITGEDGQDVFRKVYDTDLAMDVDFELSSNTSNSNKSVQIEVSQQLVGITMNPLNIQMGLSGPSEMYSAQKAYLNNLGVKDVHRFLKRPQEFNEAANLSPLEEFNRVVRGQTVPVLPQQDHAAFMAFAQTMLDLQNKGPDSRTLDSEQEQRLIEQYKAHAEMSSALEQQQAQQAVVQQMQLNSQNSQAQAPAALNPMAGTDPGQVF